MFLGCEKRINAHVWHNERCPGISPKSCSKPSSHSWERCCSDVLPGARTGRRRRGRAGTRCWFSRGTAGLCRRPISPRLIGDQSLSWCGVSIAQGRARLYELSPPARCELCVSASTSGARRCVCRLLLDGGGGGWGLRSFLRPEEETH